jgi:hypothetical protein
LASGKCDKHVIPLLQVNHCKHFIKGLIIFYFLQVSGKPSDETVRAVGLNDAVVMTEDAFIEAEGKLLQYMEAFIKQKSQQNKKATDNARSVAKAFLDEFSEIVTDSLWPEELAISRARQKTFKRTFHLRLFNAVDSKWFRFTS